jgi:hypothetical protein
MFHRNFDHFRDVAGQTPPTGLNLLAHEDVALKAYYETRGRYLGLLPAQRVFNRIGEVLPAILHDGQVVGTWTWDPQRREARCGFARNVTSPAVRRETRVRTHRLTAALRQGMSLRRPVRNDDVPPQRCQTPDVG